MVYINVGVQVLFVTQVAVDQHSGNARHVVALVNALQQRGHGVRLVAPAKTPLSTVRHLRPRRTRPGPGLELRLAAMTALELRSFRPDVAYLRLSASTSFCAGVLRAFRVPYFVELNGPILDAPRAKSKNGVRARALGPGLKKVIRGAEALVAPSPRLIAYAESRLGAERTVLVENGVDLDMVRVGDRAEARRRLGLDPDLRWLVHVGTLTPWLKLDLLRQAHAEFHGLGLLLVGGGAQEELAETMVRESSAHAPVRYLGPVPHEMAIAAMQAADVCVNAHDSDLALKSLEYAAIGRRQVCFRVPGIERLVSTMSAHQGVFVAATNDTEGLRAAIQGALVTDKDLGPIPSEALSKVRRALSWERKVERLEEIFHPASP